MRISLRGMLIGVALAAIAIASLTYANDVWLALVAGLTMIALFAVLIMGAVDRGERQALAIGFALTMIAYGFILLTGNTSVRFGSGSTKNIEFDQWEGRLPTTRLLRYVHLAVGRGGYFDVKTGNYVPDYDPTTDPMQTPPSYGGGGVFGGGGGGGMILGPSATFRELPPREFFMPIGHCWWALLLGYLGGQFATFVYARRVNKDGN